MNNIFPNKAFTLTIHRQQTNPLSILVKEIIQLKIRMRIEYDPDLIYAQLEKTIQKNSKSGLADSSSSYSLASKTVCVSYIKKYLTRKYV